MNGRYIHLFDTTLRDGAQTQGVDFSLHDKSLIAKALDDLGLDYIEGGWPGANPTDNDFFQQSLGLKKAKLVAFGMTRRSGYSAQNDPGLNDIVNSKSHCACLVAKSWDFHVDVALAIERDENLKMIASSIEYAHSKKGEAMLDCEHFFDGYKANREYALQCALSGFEAGARWIVLCDTNGGTLPHEIAEIVHEVAHHIPGEYLGIHAHNDTGNAVANSLAAVFSGACQVQGTINGLGERCGNADIINMIATLAFKTDFKIGIEKEKLKQLTQISKLLDIQINRASNKHQPWVGSA
ncbi:MAG: citramalate synthase, partial [Pseudomonadota bacterium]